jgi:glycopeptide antibiotics resistance protein
MLYLALVIDRLLLKEGQAIIFAQHANLSWAEKFANTNCIPLNTIIYYLKGNPNYITAYNNLTGNIIAFVPIGFLAPLILNNSRKFTNTFLIAFIICLSIELLQFVFNLGIFDIDDLILNVLGAVIGFIIYKIPVLLKRSILKVRFKEK